MVNQSRGCPLIHVAIAQLAVVPPAPGVDPTVGRYGKGNRGSSGDGPYFLQPGNLDWDVAVFVRPTLSERERFDLRVQLGLDLEEIGRVDVVILNDAPSLLAQSALKGRRLVVRDKTALVRFFVKTMALADDARWWGEIHLKARLRRIEEGRFGRP